MNIYSIDVNIVGTAYIKAATERDALKLAETLADTGFELSSRHQSIDANLCIDGRSFECLAENEEEIALSPAFSINGEDNHFTADSISFVEELEDEDEDVEA